MTDLIHDLFNYIPEICSVRDYKGYQQLRESLEVRLFDKISLRLKTPWMFSVIGYRDEESMENDTCFVAKTDGSHEEVPIDHKNRITIAGKKHSNWIRYR